MNVQISKWGNSLGVRLPRSLAAEVGMAEGQKVSVTAEGGKLIIAPAKRVYTIEELMVNVTPESMREAFDWGPDVGREIIDD